MQRLRFWMNASSMAFPSYSPLAEYEPSVFFHTFMPHAGALKVRPKGHIIGVLPNGDAGDRRYAKGSYSCSDHVLKFARNSEIKRSRCFTVTVKSCNDESKLSRRLRTSFILLRLS